MTGAALLSFLDQSPAIYTITGDALPSSSMSSTTIGAFGPANGPSGEGPRQGKNSCGMGADVNLFTRRAQGLGEDPVANLGHELVHAALYDRQATGRSNYPSFVAPFWPFASNGALPFIPHNLAGSAVSSMWGYPQ